jgi:hypothetical protein
LNDVSLPYYWERYAKPSIFGNNNNDMRSNYWFIEWAWSREFARYHIENDDLLKKLFEFVSKKDKRNL